MNDVPLYVNFDGSTVGYGHQCVTDISVGADNTVWALDCNPDSNGNYNIIKWNPILLQWYIVPGQTAVKIAAYNEVSAAVVTAAGKVYISYDIAPTTYLNPVAPVNDIYSGSTLVLNQISKDWLRTQLPQYGAT